MEDKKQKLAPIGKKDDVIEIKLGKPMERVRENPWILATFVLGVVLIGLILSGNSDAAGGVSSSQAGQNIINFVNAQGQGSATLVSADREGSLHKVVLNYQGQEVPVYATLDGEFLISDAIPLDLGLLENSQQPNNAGNVQQPSNVASAGQINEDDDAVLGDANAPVTIIEFSDYQCPFCQRFWSETLPLIKKDYIDTGKVKLIYRDYPISQIHPQAQTAAEAAECVRAKGGDSAYFKMHDKIFENQASLNKDNLISWADDLGYDIESCLDNGDFKDEVLADLSDGGNLGTPTFFINGVQVEGAQPYSNFKAIIDAQLDAGG